MLKMCLLTTGVQHALPGVKPQYFSEKIWLFLTQSVKQTQHQQLPEIAFLMLTLWSSKASP